MRSRRRLAAVPFLLLALAACSGDDPAPEPSTDLETIPAIEGRGDQELPTADAQREALAAAGEVTEALVAPLAAGATETAQVPDAPAGSYLLRVVCTSSDGAPVVVTVRGGETELTSYQAPCVPVYQGGSTMADSDVFEVPGGALDVTVTAAAESVVAVGLAAAAG